MNNRMRRTKAISFSMDAMSLKNMKDLTVVLNVGQSALIQNLVNEKAGEVGLSRIQYAHQCEKVLH